MRRRGVRRPGRSYVRPCNQFHTTQIDFFGRKFSLTADSGVGTIDCRLPREDR